MCGDNGKTFSTTIVYEKTNILVVTIITINKNEQSEHGKKQNETRIGNKSKYFHLADNNGYGTTLSNN